MRCLYCGKELALFKRLRGGEFCSDAHRLKYQEEYTQLALNRLLQANGAKDGEAKEGAANEGEKDSKPAKPDAKEIKAKASPAKELKPAELRPAELYPAEPQAAPAAKRGSGKEETPRESVPAPLPRVERVSSKPALIVVEPPQIKESEPEPPRKAAAAPVPEEPVIEEIIPEEEVAAASEEPPAGEVAVETAEQIDEPAPAPLLGFLVECPVAVAVDQPEAGGLTQQFAAAGAAALPRLNYIHPDVPAAQLDSAERVALSLFTVTDFPTPPHERGLEIREFVRGVPQVEIPVKPAAESGFELVQEPFDVDFEAQAPAAAPGVWFAPETPLRVDAASVVLGDLARLDFALTDWAGDAAAGEPAAEESAAAEAPAVEVAPPQVPVMAPRVQTPPVEPARQERAGAAPDPVQFAAVQVDRSVIEKIATPAAKTSAQPKPQPRPAPLPAPVTRPEPVTLHGLAPLRGKPVQVFTTAVIRTGDLQVPPATSLPLRPVMVLGAAPKPAADVRTDVKTDVKTDAKAVTQAAPAPAPAAPAPKSVPIPPKTEARPDAKARKAEVRVLPISSKPPVKPEPARPVSVRPEQPKPEPLKAEPVKAEPVKPAAPGRPEVKAPAKPEVAAKAVEPAKVERVKPVETPKPVEAAKPKPQPEPVKAPAARTAEPEKPQPKPQPTQPNRFDEPVKRPAPFSSGESMDTLGLPALSFQQKETFWTRLPAAARLGVIAGVLAVVIGGVFLTSRGTSSNKPAASTSNDPVMVEEPAMGSTAGWQQDWFVDRAAGKTRHVDVLVGSLTLRDYRLVFEGQIEHGALGWIFRGDNKSFYVEKIQVITPGRSPVLALEHFAVINGQEEHRVQTPLAMEAHLDTLYKVRMDAIGDKFTTYVQDQKIDQWTDSRLTVGGVGLYYDAGDSAKLRDTLNVIPLKRKQ